MNQRRWIAGLALGALLAVQVLPAQATRMLCGMKAARSVEVCSRCDDTGSADAAALRARSCCRVVPNEPAESAPGLVTTGRKAPTDVALNGLVGAPSDACLAPRAPRSHTVLLSSHPILEVPTRTTVLRN